MPDSLTVTDNRTGRSYELPISHGSIRATDLQRIKLSDDDPRGLLSYDPAFLNTASCISRITYIDGDRGILLYRGYPIEELAERSNFLETAYLLVHGELPTAEEYTDWTHEITMHTLVHENIKRFMDGFHHDAHPMGMLLSIVGALATFYPEATNIHDAEQRRVSLYRLIAKMPTLAAYAYRHSKGLLLRPPRQRPLVCGQLPEHDVQDGRAEVPAGAGDRARPRRALHPPRRPRAELLHQRDALGGLCPARSLFGDRRGRSPRSTVRSTGAPTRRCCAC